MTLTDKLQAVPDRERLAAHLSWFAGVRRDTGGTGEAAAVDYIADQLRASGVEVRIHEFQAFLSYPREASIAVAGAPDFSPTCLTHSFTRSTPAAGITGRLTYLPDGDLSESGGGIVLVDGLCTPITVLEASRAGVQAIVFINPGDVVHNMTATTIWGTPSADQLDRLPTVCAFSLSRPDGERLKQLLATGLDEVTLKARVETGWYTSKLPEAIIRGNGPDAGQFVLVGAHYCSWEYGITDNATGDACLLEMARALQAHRTELNRSVRLCWWPGHSHGRYAGSAWYADTFFSDLADNCIAYHNIDSPGVRDATTYVARYTTAEIEEFCSGLIGEMTGQADVPVHRPARAADQSFLANGIPSFSTYPFLPEGHEDRKPWTGGCANAWWWHSSCDTLDKADTGILELDTKISLTGVARLANAEILPLNPQRIIAEASGYAAEFATATRTHLDTTELTTAAAELSLAGTEFAQAMAGATGEAGQRSVNLLLLKLSRILTPVAYSAGGRFVHDPSEWTPLKHNTRAGLYPGLTPGLSLPELAGSNEYGFVKAGVVRQLNRTVAAWREAAEVCRSLGRAV